MPKMVTFHYHTAINEDGDLSVFATYGFNFNNIYLLPIFGQMLGIRKFIAHNTPELEEPSCPPPNCTWHFHTFYVFINP